MLKSLLAAMILVTPLAVRGEEPMIITKDTTFEKGAVLHHGLIIRGNNITIDGNGATLQGEGEAGDKDSLGKAGIGIQAEGCTGVTLKNLNVHGFETALVATEGAEWTIEGCDFSDNYNDPDYGWGEGERNGGIILTGMNHCTIVNNKATNVWNGLDLRDCNDNTIEKNNFSHCGNVCLKMWASCRNVVRDNNLSYGLRIRPGEVHARDSTSVLIESGSNDNLYERNDITHGGDGIFIRVLNAWVSTGNVFIENDCSYANNNAVEAWSPGNTYIRNKANHSSYGFWLGGSDHTVLIGNEAAYNGQPDGFHNAPEPGFTHGGIVIVHGSGSHTIVKDNYCHHNNGAGIVFQGHYASQGEAWKMFHWVIENNRLENNRWGIFAKFADWIDINGNHYKDNENEDFFEKVSNRTVRPPAPEGLEAPEAVLEGPVRAEVGQKVTFDASKSKDPAGKELKYVWHLEDAVAEGPAKVDHTYKAPGFYRVGLTVSNEFKSDLAWVDLYVTAPVKEMGTEGESAAWGWRMGDNAEGKGKVELTDSDVALIGKKSLQMRPDPYRGADVTVFYPKSQSAGWDLSGKKMLSFWIKFVNPNFGFQGPNPIIRLHSGKAAFTYTPAYPDGRPRNLLGDFLYSEARWGWTYVQMPLDASAGFTRSETISGGRPPQVDNQIEFVTVETSVETQDSSSMVSDGKNLYLATLESGRIFRSADGREWTELTAVGAGLETAGPAWINGMLSYYAAGGPKGSLILRCRAPEKNAFGQEVYRLVAFDLAEGKWSWVPTDTILGHGAVVVGDAIFGIAHAIMGNYGGPICRVNLKDPAPRDERTVLDVKGEHAAWFSRAGQLAVVNGKIYGTKNDGTTPPPAEPGDRLYVFDPAEFKASAFKEGNPWDSNNWSAAVTPTTDLGQLPFEIGHGSCLVAVPPSWCAGVGDKGGLFLVAACSPSNNEGYGQPSTKYAIHDIASGKFVVQGSLPEPTGTGTSGTFHDGKVYIKRGGTNFGPTNAELWVVKPLSAEKAKEIAAKAKKERMTLDKIDSVSFQFDSMDWQPFDIWIDGLTIE